MKKYFLLLNEDTLEVYVSQPLKNKPVNSIEFFENSFIKAGFNVYPNPTSVIEKATQEEIDFFNDALIPNTISQMKFRMQLILSGISLESIYETINSIEDKTTRDIILTKFDYADVMERNDESLLQMATIMGISKEQVNQIFINGNNIQEK